MATGYTNFQNETTETEKSERRDSEPPPYAFGAPTGATQAPVFYATTPQLPVPGAPAGVQGSQPQLVVLAKPQKQQRPEITRRRRRVAFICGVIELAAILVLLILGIVFVGKAEASMSFHAFLVALLGVATAVLSLIAGVKGHRGSLIAGLVMAIITAVVSGAFFILSIIMCGIFASDADSVYNHGRGPDVHYRTLAALFGASMIVHLVIILACLVQSGFACSELCPCCHSEDPMSGARFAYIAQPDQNGQLVFSGGQAMPVVDMGRQNIPPPVLLSRAT